MLIVCPSCASEYAIDPNLIGAGGRRMRCAACRTTWRVGAPPSVDDPPARDAVSDPSEPVPDVLHIEARSGRSAPAEAGKVRVARDGAGALARRAGDAARWAARPAAALLVVAAPAGLLGWRERVVRAIPETAAFYAAIGLPVNLRGLDFRNVSAFLAVEGDPQLVIEGEVVGLSGGIVPPIVLAVRGDDVRPLYSWTIEPPRAKVAPGEAARFRAKLASPPAEARAALVRFGEPPGAALALRTP